MTRRLLAIALGLLISNAALAQYSEPFNDDGADVKINADADTAATFLDYSSLGLPEAPRSSGGDVPTSGLKLEANLAGGAGAGVNVLAGATPMAFSGNYRVSYDVYMSFGGSNGTTEQAVWGAGNDDSPPSELRINRGSGTIGTWGWIAGENGYGTEDATIQENDVELADLGDTQLLEDIPFNLAFMCDANNEPTNDDSDAPNGAMAFEWVQVDIDVSDNGDGSSDVAVYYNFVEFFSETVSNAAVSGFAMLGYEDPFGSVNDDPANTWGVFDNFHVTMDPTGAPSGTVPVAGCVPEPSTALMLLFGLLGVLKLNRR